MRNVMSPAPLHIATGGMSFPDFMKLMKRWMAFGRNGLPFEFTRPMWMRGLEFWISMLTLALAIGTHHYLAALAPAVALVAFEASQLKLNRIFGGAAISAKYLWMPFMIPIMAPIETVMCMVNKKVEWRGRAYDLDVNARLA
jgi:hypothetical protein